MATGSSGFFWGKFSHEELCREIASAFSVRVHQSRPSVAEDVGHAKEVPVKRRHLRETQHKMKGNMDFEVRCSRE